MVTLCWAFLLSFRHLKADTQVMQTQNNHLPVTRSACRIRRSFNLFLNLGFSRLSFFRLNAGSNFGTKVNENPNAVISRRLKMKELSIRFLHFLVFPSYTVLKPSFLASLLARSIKKSLMHWEQEWDFQTLLFLSFDLNLKWMLPALIKLSALTV